MTARRRGRTLSVGDPVLLLPSHCDTTINLYDEMHVIGSDGPPTYWSISARGALR
jgi:D-serine deaminase-like pyridoxal phosphate-dependent protein